MNFFRCFNLTRNINLLNEFGSLQMEVTNFVNSDNNKLGNYFQKQTHLTVNEISKKSTQKIKKGTRRALQKGTPEIKKTLHRCKVLIISGEYRNRTDDLLTASQTL